MDEMECTYQHRHMHSLDKPHPGLRVSQEANIPLCVVITADDKVVSCSYLPGSSILEVRSGTFPNSRSNTDLEGKN